MNVTQIVRTVNDKLAGENLSYDSLKTHLDAAIDDINNKLNSTFPVFSEFNANTYPDRYPNYNFFPDKYIRSVVVPGAALKFFTTDEEGAASAPEYGKEYAKNMFLMERDYMMQVPVEFQADNQGFIEKELTEYAPTTYWG